MNFTWTQCTIWRLTNLIIRAIEELPATFISTVHIEKYTLKVNCLNREIKLSYHVEGSFLFPNLQQFKPKLGVCK